MDGPAGAGVAAGALRLVGRRVLALQERLEKAGETIMSGNECTLCFAERRREHPDSSQDDLVVMYEKDPQKFEEAMEKRRLRARGERRRATGSSTQQKTKVVEESTDFDEQFSEGHCLLARRLFETSQGAAVGQYPGEDRVAGEGAQYQGRAGCEEQVRSLRVPAADRRFVQVQEGRSPIPDQGRRHRI